MLTEEIRAKFIKDFRECLCANRGSILYNNSGITGFIIDDVMIGFKEVITNEENTSKSNKG